MSNIALIDTSNLTDIGDAIRYRDRKEGLIPTVEMADRIRNLTPGLEMKANNHCDEDGRWHKPDDWDDIESIDLTGKHECYILCGVNIIDDPWVQLYIEGGSNRTWSYGHVVNGEYIIYEGTSEQSLAGTGSGYFGLDLAQFKGTDNYIVIRVKSDTGLKQVRPTVSSSYPGYKNYGVNVNCVLMRYARLTKVNNPTFPNYFIESDRLVDLGSELTAGSSVTMSSFYQNCYNLQRVDWGNFNPANFKVTSFASMFSNCYMLSDLANPFDMTGWVTSNCTNISNMFNGCFCIRGELIVKNWNLSKVTTMATFLTNARSITKITGMDTWTSAPVCTSAASFAGNTWSLTGVLDFSKVAFTNKLSCSMKQAFEHTKCLSKVILNNCDFTNVTDMGSMCQYSGISEIVWDTNFTPPSGKLTTIGTMFGYCQRIKEVVFDGWDFSTMTGSRTLGNMCCGNWSTEKIVFKNCTYPTAYKDDGTNSSPLYTANGARYIDFSEFDMSTCTSTYMHANLLAGCALLVDFYPPKNICKATKLSDSYMLSHDSLIRILNNLSTVTTATTLTIGVINLAKLTDDEKAIATGKGWTLA